MASRVVFQRGSLRPEHGVIAGAFLLRLIALLRLVSFGALKPSGGDMLFYQQWAERILHGQLTEHIAFYGLPLYAYWLAAIYKLAGTALFLPLLLQAAVDAMTAMLIYKIGETVFSRSESAPPKFAVPLIAAIGWIFFVPAQAYSIVLMPTSFAVLVFWFAVWCALRPSTGSYVASGLALGIGAMAVANVLLATPLLVWRAIVHRRIAAIAALLAAIVVGTAPCWIHNIFVARDPVFLSAHGGINFWVGNHPGANGYPHFAGLRSGQTELLAQSIDLAEVAAGHPLKRSQVSAFWSAKARDFIFTQPVTWLALVGRKFANFWNAFEYDDIGVIQQLRRGNIIFPGLHFGIVASFALPGILFAWRAAPRSIVVSAAVFLSLVGLLALFITERYRLVAVPGLLLAAGFGLVEFGRTIATGNHRFTAIYLLLLAGCTGFVSIPRREPSLWAVSSYNAGRAALEAGDLATAENDLQRAHAYAPQNAETNFALANLRLAQGERSAAEQLYRRTLMLDRQHKGALTNLGVLALDKSDFEAAEMYLRQALTSAPRDAKAHFLLARALFARGDRDGAAREAQIAVALDPAQPEFKSLRAEIDAASR